MNIDNLHDALNLLDDDLIHEVDVLRSEGMQQKIKGSRKWIVRWMSLAACFVIFLVSAYAVSTLLLRGFGGAKKSDSSVMVEENTTIKGDSPTTEEDKEALPSQDSSTESENASAASGEAKSEAHEIIVEVTELINAGFVGVIKKSADTETYTEGTKLTVLMMEKDSTGGNSTIDVQHLTDELSDVAFPVGSVVIVRFMNQDVVDTGSEEIMLYADSVTFEDNE